MTGTVLWVDGALVDEGDACISPFDRALLTGDGVFETLAIHRGAPFAATRHLQRLARSAAVLRLPLPEPGVLARAMAEVVAANHLVRGRMRVTVTGGPGRLGAERGDAGPTVIVAAAAQPPWPPWADVVVVPWPRNERGALAGVKSVSYGENVVALRRARDEGADEAIFANLAGDLCEGTGTTVFLGLGGRLLTPPLSSGCLAGVTRDLVCELVEVAEEAVPVGALAEADEAFLTSSTREVQAVRAVDGRVLRSVPGSFTLAAAAALADLVARTLDP